MNPLVATKAAAALTERGKEEAKGFLKTVLRAPGEALGGLLADAINERRHANLIKIAGRAQERLSSAGVSAKEVPLSIIHPAIEAASLEEDPDLQEIWANLLANAADPRAEQPMPPSFPTILRELSSKDVRFLNAMFQRALDEADPQNGRYRRYKSVGAVQFGHRDAYDIFSDAGLARCPSRGWTFEFRQAYANEIEADNRDAEMCMDSLRRHELIIETIDLDEERGYVQGASGPITYKLPVTSCELKHIYTFSRLGVAFVNACRPPSK